MRRGRAATRPSGEEGLSLHERQFSAVGYPGFRRLWGVGGEGRGGGRSSGKGRGSGYRRLDRLFHPTTGQCIMGRVNMEQW